MRVKIWSGFKTFLELLSVGKYDMKLYDERKNALYSSWIGGLLTLMMIIFIFFISFRIIVDTFNKKNIFVENIQIRMEDSVIQNMTMGELVQAGLKFPEYQVKVS